ncbi:MULTISPECIES: alpha/beta hydrolase [Gammaproteobacteria]|uniref:alpha/beta hydrolase n=1 Tax=Gammaproteobacteria TaxID=1236 RepID=UPI000DD0BBB7|nr:MULTISPECIES: alpha/beta hydrolase [Gammaproteobacteria]RTE85808.1 alpha/beta hydrolase [Aliidiomarina sp. B3213]TCZ90190.1 alpha/beta hydrolase [Lysobacter sp. N42]
MKYIRLVIILLLSISATSTVHASSPEQVSFTSVTELEYAPADEVLFYGNAEQQFVEYWAGTSNRNVVLVHGGCWLNAYGVDHIRPTASELAEQGFHVWAVEYRRLGDENGGWPTSKHDVAAAIDLVASRAGDSPIVVAGHSAGGHLALLAAENTQTQVSQVMGLAAITNLEHYAQQEGSCQGAGAQFLATASASERDELNVKQSSTLSRILFAGDSDPIVPARQAELGNTSNVVIHGAGHFDFVHPETSAWQTWVGHLHTTFNALEAE